jgi:hypothetical protein
VSGRVQGDFGKEPRERRRGIPTALPWAVNGVPRLGRVRVGASRGGASRVGGVPCGGRPCVGGGPFGLGCPLPAHRRCISLASPRQRRGKPSPKTSPALKGRPKNPCGKTSPPSGRPKRLVLQEGRGE